MRHNNGRACGNADATWIPSFIRTAYLVELPINIP
jgi:hypothetical protein